MARARTYQGILGRVKGATWGTAVACGATHGVEALALDTPFNTSLIEDLSIQGRVTQREAAAGVRAGTVTLRTYLRYEGNEPEIAYVMGTAGAPSTVDTTGKLHLFKIKDSLDGIFETLAFELIKDTKIVELPSVKWNRLVLRGQNGVGQGKLELEVSGIPDDWKDDSSTNTTTTIDTITLPANREHALITQTVLLMNAQGGAGLAGSDAVYVEGFEIAIERAMQAVFTTERNTRSSEPIETDFLKVTGTFNFAVLDTGTGGNAAFMAEQMAATRKKATLAITSPTLAGAATEFFKHKLWLPNIQFGDGKPGWSSPGVIRWSQPFRAWHVTSAPTGFTAGYVDSVTWENISQRAGDALA